MAIMTKGGLLLPLIFVAAVAVVGVPQLRDQALNLYYRITGGTELVGEGSLGV